MEKEFESELEFVDYFKDEETCLRYFEAMRFRDGEFCPHCKHTKIMRLKGGKRFRCHKCRKDFTIKTGTLFGESRLPLRTWFMAIFHLTNRKKGISSVELARILKVEQRTAWFMNHRIREAMKQGRSLLDGIVEIDETYVSGRNSRKDGFSKKKVVMGMTERGGKIKAYHIPHRGTEVLLPTIKKHVNSKAIIMTDEARVYTKLPKVGYHNHHSIKHGKGHYVRGNVHTNSIESFWALFKRGHHGTYHKMSKQHFQRYINEFTYRFNNREADIQEMFDAVIERMAKRGKLSYKTLTA